jgi:RND superfamily putative drug exporter
MQTRLNPFGTDAMNQIHGIVDRARGPHPDALLRAASISASGVTAMLRDTRAYYGQHIKLIIAMAILIVFLILVASRFARELARLQDTRVDTPGARRCAVID